MSVGLAQEFKPHNRPLIGSERARYLNKLSTEAKRKRALERKTENKITQRSRPAQSYVDTIRRNVRRLSAQIQASNNAVEVDRFATALRKLVDIESVLIGRVVQTGKVRSTNPLPKLSDLDPITPKLSSTVPQPCQPPLTPVETAPVKLTAPNPKLPTPQVELSTDDDCPF